jgi:methylated-DNA-[protein]-cysteine S-methyltransferase
MNQLRYHSLPSPLGPLLLLANDADRLCGLYLPDHKGGPSAGTGRHDAGGVIQLAAVQLDDYFSEVRMTFDLPLATRGTPLQEQVWAALRSVPYGRTTTYGRIAADLGMGPRAARAVGTANARNPLSIVVPCHRVVGARGSLTGYAGGLEAKRRLLTHEARIAGRALDLNDDACWTMVQRRDPAADGRFIVGVRTTGVYCRPTCAGRPLRRNVVYFRNVEQARSYGLRACRRCAPDATEALGPIRSLSPPEA